MEQHEKFMQRAVELAEKGFARTRPNPLVGAVLVQNGEIIAEGFHREFGGPHAEIECFASLDQGRFASAPLGDAVLYVSLEPCAHQGKTPPCTDEIIRRGIRHVVIGCLDPNPQVNGRGVAALRAAGTKITAGVLENQARSLNKRFITFHENKRPYIILKWAQTSDGFIADSNNQSKWITGDSARSLVHRFRDEEQAIMVGTTTVIYDNPFLTARIQNGRNPVRVLIDRTQKIPTSFNVFDETAKTILFNEIEDYSYGAAELIKIDFSESVLPRILAELYNRNLQSLFVEGGATLLNSFIEAGLWDEARIFVGSKKFGKGLKAPALKLPSEPVMTFDSGKDSLFIVKRSGG